MIKVRDVLIEELGEQLVNNLHYEGTLMLIEWAMLQYHEKMNKNLNIDCVSNSAKKKCPYIKCGVKECPYIYNEDIECYH